MSNTHECRICNNRAGNRPFVAREMMFGLRDEFEYFECTECGCIQIAKVPDNIASYYPPEYYSFAKTRQSNVFRRWVNRHRGLAATGKPSPVGRLLVKCLGVPPAILWTRRAGVDCDAAILDVGSGGGIRLLEFQTLGFSNVMGIDPYIDEDVIVSDTSRVRRCSLDECEGQFDLVMLHHSFEHMTDPLDTMREVRRLIAHGGCALVRIPVAGSVAWQNYGADWVQLDAPRHIFLHSVRSIEICAEVAGLRVADIDFDSTAFQFWGSEQYKRGIPLESEQSFLKGNRSLFKKQDIRRFREHADNLNRSQQGDQACFYLRAAG